MAKKSFLNHTLPFGKIFEIAMPESIFRQSWPIWYNLWTFIFAGKLVFWAKNMPKILEFN